MAGKTLLRCHVVWCTKLPDITTDHLIFYVFDDIYAASKEGELYVADIQHGKYYADFDISKYKYQTILDEHCWSFMFNYNGVNMEFASGIDLNHRVIRRYDNNCTVSEPFQLPPDVCSKRTAILHQSSNDVIVRCNDYVLQIRIE